MELHAYLKTNFHADSQQYNIQWRGVRGGKFDDDKEIGM